MFSAYILEVNVKNFMIFNLFYLVSVSGPMFLQEIPA
jgi:hypothetical protein